ncbi:transposase domain-containing protein [Streptomyces sp. NPDC127051]|uniref:transposase domain-containing protein n=1 Tax=Streptomyces sp. NPDC127051 TaxID=3347119 RepID=UPI0036660D63
MVSSPEIVAPEVPLPQHSAIPPPVASSAHDVYAPGHLGELTQVIDPQLADAVLEETGSRERRVRLLPARVVLYFVLALAFFERASYRAVWDKLSAGLHPLAAAQPCAPPLSRARRRLGSAPLRRLFEVLAGPVTTRAQPGSFSRGLRVAAVGGTTLSIPDENTVTWRSLKHGGRCSSSCSSSATP